MVEVEGEADEVEEDKTQVEAVEYFNPENWRTLHRLLAAAAVTKGKQNFELGFPKSPTNRYKNY